MSKILEDILKNIAVSDTSEHGYDDDWDDYCDWDDSWSDSGGGSIENEP